MPLQFENPTALWGINICCRSFYSHIKQEEKTQRRVFQSAVSTINNSFYALYFWTLSPPTRTTSYFPPHRRSQSLSSPRCLSKHARRRHKPFPASLFYQHLFQIDRTSSWSAGGGLSFLRRRIPPNSSHLRSAGFKECPFHCRPVDDYKSRDRSDYLLGHSTRKYRAY